MAGKPLPGLLLRGLIVRLALHPFEGEAFGSEDEVVGDSRHPIGCQSTAAEEGTDDAAARRITIDELIVGGLRDEKSFGKTC